MQQRSQGERSEPCGRRISAGGEDHGGSQTKGYTGGYAASEIFEVLGKDVARHEVRHEQNVSVTGDRRRNALFVRCSA
jgi:hypothetical protein